MFSINILLALITLTALEIVLGFDNLVIVAILTEKLSAAQRPAARRLGLALALITRVLLLSLAFYTAQLSTPFAVINNYGISVRDILMLGGGLFLIIKGLDEIRDKMLSANAQSMPRQHSSLSRVIMQIAVMDILFSFDTVMTAIGLAKDLWVMVLAIILAMAAMVWLIDDISNFINRHVRIKILALTYMLLIGVILVANAFHLEIPKSYLYSALGFSCFVELIQMAVKHRRAKAN